MVKLKNNKTLSDLRVVHLSQFYRAKCKIMAFCEHIAFTEHTKSNKINLATVTSKSSITQSLKDIDALSLLTSCYLQW